MPLPPRGDPLRPVQLAVRSMRLMGGLLVLFGTCAAVPQFVMRGGGRAAAAPSAWYIVVVLAFYLLPGVCFIVFAIFLGRLKLWAAVASICLASMAALFAVAALVVSAVFIIRSGSGFQGPMIVSLTIPVLLVAAMGQLVYHLARSFEAIKQARPPERGFEPIMVPPAAATAMYQQQHEQPPPPPADV